MTVFNWARTLLVDFIVPMAWPLVVLAAVLLLRAELRTVVQKLADSIDRVRTGKIGSAEVTWLPVPGTKALPPPATPSEGHES